MGQVSSCEPPVIAASFDYVLFDTEPNTDHDTPRFWERVEGDDSSKRLPEWKTVAGITLTDVRRQQHQYDLQTSGFQLTRLPMKCVPDPNRQQTVASYLADTTAQVKRLINATEVICFDYRVSKK
jgi:hypothetical protein